MRIVILILSIAVLAVSLTGCKFQTPEIRGIVLDSETKEPVEGAWITGSIGVKTKTVAGKVGKVISLEPPHTRTGKDGRFVIPSRSLKKPPFPVSFGSQIDRVGMGAETVDDKGGGMTLEGEKLKELLGKDVVEVTITINPVERKEEEYFSDIQSLYRYCLTGRFGIEVPPVEGGCDDWELDFAIIKHEGYLERLVEPKTMDQRIYYAGTMKQLAYLYKMKGDFKKALEKFKEVKAFEEKRGVDLWLKEFERQITELQQILQEKQK